MENNFGIGAGRQKTLRSIEEKGQLTKVTEPNSIEDVIKAVEEISISRTLSPPRTTVERIEEVYYNLPTEARSHYIRDNKLLRRINAARRQFNDWMGKRKRMAEMPSPMEAGRSKYPMQRAQKRSRLEDEAREELEEKLGCVQSTARGARQRALDAIGSSVAEETEAKREQQRKDLREQLSEGVIVRFRNPQLRAGQVVRVNRKSVRVQYSNPRAGSTFPVSGEEQPETVADRIRLDSEYLERLEADTIAEGQELIERREQI